MEVYVSFYVSLYVISQVSLSRDDVVFAVREVPEEKSHCKFVSLLAANCSTIRK